MKHNGTADRLAYELPKLIFGDIPWVRAAIEPVILLELVDGHFPELICVVNYVEVSLQPPHLVCGISHQLRDDLRCPQCELRTPNELWPFGLPYIDVPTRGFGPCERPVGLFVQFVGS